MIRSNKILVLFGLLFALQFQTSLKAQLQQSTQEVTFTAYLNSAFQLVVGEGGDQVATFNNADDYNLGITETQGSRIVPGYTTVTMIATGNWNLKIQAPDFSPTGTATGSIPINNLGVYCEATGIHQFGVDVTCDYTTVDNPMGLTNIDQTLIDLLTENSGDGTDNAFTLHWVMGIMYGSMNPASMFLQLTNGDFSIGTYTTTVLLTMTEVP